MTRERGDGPGLVMMALVAGWVVMIFLGVLYKEFDVLRPIGFWPSLAIALPVAIIIAAVARLLGADDDFVGSFVGAALVLGFAIMLALGAAHHELGALRPLGYWASAGLGLPLALLLGVLWSRREDSGAPAARVRGETTTS
ncbi:MAG TPA: hypothetical protein VNE62_02570 [Actinomycetota bacterium]|nr:hypothetical protein [Actinomycetota bacterium]